MATRQKRRTGLPDRESLMEILVDRLTSGSGGGFPRVLRMHYERTGRLALTVIWDRWNDIPLNERSEIILNAVNRTPDLDSDRIVFAIGMTIDEALDAGYFPFRIEADMKGSDPQLRGEIEAAFEEEGAVEVSGRRTLLFGILEDAKDAYTRLLGRVPGPHWVIIKEVVRDA